MSIPSGAFICVGLAVFLERETKKSGMKWGGDGSPPDSRGAEV
jgi:hypothetical protein